MTLIWTEILLTNKKIFSEFWRESSVLLWQYLAYHMMTNANLEMTNTIRRQSMKGLAILVLVLSAPFGHAASFDCGRARQPVEKMVCENLDLSRADDELGFSYDYLESRCPSQFEDQGVRATQRKWLASLKPLAKQGGSDPSFLADAYRERNTFLSALVLQCAPQYPKPESVTVKALELRSGHSKATEFYPDLSMPFVETDPPKIGRLINNQIFGDFFDLPAPKHLADGMPSLLEEYRSRDRRSPDEVRFSTVINNGRLLVLKIFSSGCDSSCSSGEDVDIFDLWSGRRIHATDLLSYTGANTIAERFRLAKLRRGWSVVRQEHLDLSPNCKRDGAKCERPSNRDGDFLMNCAKDDSEKDHREYWSIEPETDGRWQFSTIWGCHDSRQGKSGRPFVQRYTSDELRPLLNDYGRSLLLGEGDAPEPVPDDALCTADSRFSNPVAEKAKVNIRSVHDTHGNYDQTLALFSDGTLWCRDEHWRKKPAVRAGTNIAQIDTVSFSSVVGILKDGTLINWVGSVCPDGNKSGFSPLAISPNQSRVMAGNEAELWSLGRDGTLWLWGPRTPTSPFKAVTDVADIGHGRNQQLQMLKRDGSLWAWGRKRGENHANDPESWLRIGGGFARLAGNGADMAFRADGSLWSWGESLQAFTDIGGHLDHGPTKVGDDYVSIHWANDGYAVGVKRDSSLWASYQRGNRTQMEPLGCGYKEAVALGYAGNFPRPPDDVIVLGLRQDGHLVGWGNWMHSDGWSRDRIFSQAPIDFGKGFAQIFQIGSSYNSYAVLVKRDGSLWEFRPPRTPGTPAGKDVLQKIDLSTKDVSKH
jgi:hypothetical protein